MPERPPTEPTAEPRPFLKWAGGKRQLIDSLLPHVPAEYGCFHEPFLGGGALFFAARPDRAVLTDLNQRLIRTYQGVKDDVEGVIALLSEYREQHCRAFFNQMRDREIDGRTDTDVAAWLIYLNKTAFNGLYRVNRHGRFNVPIGSYKNPGICDADNLRTCSALLQTAELKHTDFAAVLDDAKPGDFVYFDPPYVPLSLTSNFTSYTRHGFTIEDQERLRDVARELKVREVKVLVSNSSSPLVRDLYEGEFKLEEVTATRLINSKATGRGRILELLIS